MRQVRFTDSCSHLADLVMVLEVADMLLYIGVVNEQHNRFNDVAKHHDSHVKYGLAFYCFSLFCALSKVVSP